MARTAESQNYDWPDEVYFHPWVGRNYDLGCGPNQRRLLVVGESHYCDPDRFANGLHQGFTIDCVEGISSDEWRHRFFTAIVQMVEGRERWEVDLAEFWESIAFYNFIQECLEGPKASVTEQMLRNGRNVFPAILEQLQPDCMLVLSGRAWDYWIDGWSESAPLSVNNQDYACREFARADGGTTFCTWVYHPASFGFGSGLNYHPVVNALLSR